MLKLVFLSFISIVVICTSMILYILFFLPNHETKIKIKEHEISKKLNSNQAILIPSDFEVKGVYLIDDGFLSQHIEVHLSNEITISIYLSNGLDYEGGEKVKTKIINNMHIREYQTKDKRVIYIFKVGQLNYLYEFNETYRESIDEYLSKNIF
ncbi:hypothetical protein [Gottfriedia acidiceleris]|uniref:hypothetical protein n=1 Tax=Gottfriedia acidiceleris TaxID=371036 RepID=UPI000B44219C|nr:hypothetical protein [Gottfriedia acidiceleris]